MRMRMRHALIALLLLLLVAPTAAWAQIAKIDSASRGSTNNNTATATITSTANVTLLIVACVDSSSAAITDSVDGGAGNTWTPLTEAGPTSQSTTVNFWYVYSPSVGANHAFTCTATAGYPAIAVLAVSGAQTSSDPFDVQNGAFSNVDGTSQQPGSVTPTANNELVVTAIVLSTNITGLAVDRGTLDQSVAVSGTSWGLGLAFEVLSGGSGVGVNPTWSWTTAQKRATNIATFKESAAASTLGNNSRMGLTGAGR